MRRILGFMAIAFLTSCLVPGAPQYFHFKNRSSKPLDSVILVSFPNHIDYRYWQGNLKLDSIYLVNPFRLENQRMNVVSPQHPGLKKVSYLSIYDKQRWNLKKVNNINFVLLKKYLNNVVVIDTFYKASK